MDMKAKDETPDLDLLNELANQEDEFDVDLMACGCRLVAETQVAMSVDDLVKLYDFDVNGMVEFAKVLVDKGGLDLSTVSDAAESAHRTQS